MIPAMPPDPNSAGESGNDLAGDSDRDPSVNPAGDLEARARRIFDEILNYPAEHELHQRCDGDVPLAARVRALLRAHGAAGAFLGDPTFAAAAEAAVADQAGPLHFPAGATVTAARRPEPDDSQRIGPYKLLQKIGEGGFGAVYMAEQEQPIRRHVALKLIKLGMDTRQVIARFEAERQALALMDHLNIAKVLDAGATPAGGPFFVMELVRGVPITEYCDAQQLSTQQRLELFVVVCQAVQHAHQKGIIHRDIKPSNILVTVQDGKPVPKVIDFGIAKATQVRLTEMTLFTEFRQMIGTPEYMSPEQASVDTADIDTRSDVYSLGVLLYELLTGSTPFQSRELRSKAYAEIQRIIREVEPPSPSARLSTIGDVLPSIAARRRVEPVGLGRLVRGELDWIAMKCLEKDRARRYESASALAADVMRHLADEPVLAAAPSRRYRLHKFIRRNKVPVVVCTSFVSVLLVGIIGTTIGLIGQARQRAEAQRQAAIAAAVGQFQSDMLASADPYNMLRDKVTVLEVVTAAAKDLDAGKLRDEPLVEAGVRQTIGNTFRGLGSYKEAEPHLRKAVDAWRAARPADNRATALAVIDLAADVTNQGRAEEAEKLYREAMQLGSRAWPPGDSRAIRLPALLADALCRQEGKLDQAEEVARKGLENARRLLPPANLDLGYCAYGLGKVLHNEERFADAEKLYRETYRIFQRGFPPGDPEIAMVLGDLAWLLSDQGRFDEAESLFAEALATYESRLPPEHPQIGFVLNNLGLLLLNEGKYDKAMPLFERSLQIHQHALPPDSPALAIVMNNYAQALLHERKYETAESLFRDSLRILRNAHHPTVPNAVSNLGAALLKEGRPAEALPLFIEALATTDPRQPWNVGKTHVLYGQALLELGRRADAERELLAAEPMVAAAPKMALGYHERCVQSLIKLYEGWDQAEPGKYGAKAALWRAKLPATTNPASTQSSHRLDF
jgi:serine/threonine protein kinase/Tfp pilus assembly protein PilF